MFSLKTINKLLESYLLVACSQQHLRIDFAHFYLKCRDFDPKKWVSELCNRANSFRSLQKRTNVLSVFKGRDRGVFVYNSFNRSELFLFNILDLIIVYI